MELFISVTVILLLLDNFFQLWGKRNKYAKDGASINKEVSWGKQKFM